MIALLTTAALSFAGPYDGVCRDYGLGGDVQCQMAHTADAVYIHDGNNTIRYDHVYGPVYHEYINNVSQGHKLCSREYSSITCLMGIEFETNED